MTNTKWVLGLAAVVTLLGGAAEARGDTITFNGTVPENGFLYLTEDASNITHHEMGYSLDTGSQLFFIDSSSAWPGLATFDDDVLEFNDDTASFVMTKDGGGAFDLLSVETGSLGRDSYDDGNFIFEGTFFGGGTVAQTVLALGAAPGTTTFNGFTNLMSLSVTTSDGRYVVLDNIVVNAAPPVPEPTSLALVGIGAVGLAAHRRRKRRKA